MTTSMTPNGTTGNKLGFWKILGIIAVVLLAIAMVGPLLKGLFWIALIGLAIYGGFMLFRSKSANRPNGPTSV